MLNFRNLIKSKREKNLKDELGVIHGRFQILHNDHLKYLIAGKASCKHLIVGITNPDPSRTKEEAVDPHRSLPSANPLTYYERYQMIKLALDAKGLNHDEYSLVPFPINQPELYKYYVPLDAIFYLTIYDEWGRKKEQYFQELKLETRILWEKPKAEKGITSSRIRALIMSKKKWMDLVPIEVYEFLLELDIEERLNNIQ